MEVIIVFASLFTLSFAQFQNLADPQSACLLATSSKKLGISMLAQQGFSPYKVLILQKSEVFMGQSVEIMLSSPIARPLIAGFVVHVEDVNSQEEDKPVGSFKLNSDVQADIVDCDERNRTVAVHKDLHGKVHIKLEWIPPREGEYVPVVTWFKTNHTFWLNQRPSHGKTIKVSKFLSSSARLPAIYQRVPSIDQFLKQKIVVFNTTNGRPLVVYAMGDVVFHYVLIWLVIVSSVIGSLVYWFNLNRKVAKVRRMVEAELRNC